MAASKAIIGLIAWIVVTFCAAFVGGMSLPGEWYAQLNKPSWNPPSWIFGPVWTILYLLMAFSAWLVWKSAGFGNAKLALSFFILQLVLNAMWSWIFFGRHNPGLAFGDIILLWLAIVVTILLFWKHSPLAGALLIPYILWVSFASVLNYTIWRLNIK